MLAKRSVRQLFTSRAESASIADIIKWWELRRLSYNLIVGAAGLLSAAVLIATAFTCERSGGAPIGLPDPPILAVIGAIGFGVLANICFTAGWITELLGKVGSAESVLFGPVMFALGTAFSVLVAVTPAVLALVVATLTACVGWR